MSNAKEILHHFPAGRYYIGDLCYVLDWDEVGEVTKWRDGEFHLKDGTKFVTYGTAYGDGSYPAVDGYTNEVVDYCPVDSGTIGLVSTDGMNEFDAGRNGIVVDMKEDFCTSPEFVKYGTLRFGHIFVHTE